VALEVNDLVGALLEADRDAAVAIALTAARGGRVEDVYDAIQHAMDEVGRRWQSNELTVAQEHAATAVAQHVLARVFGELPRADDGRGRAVIATVPGERHQLGSQIVADSLECDGWAVVYLGADVPADALAEEAAWHEASLVGLSVTTPVNLPALREATGALRDRLGDALTIAIGGRAATLVEAADVAADFRAPGWREARALARVRVAA
jgi:methanogenic corrinoid protein MtbC1